MRAINAIGALLAVALLGLVLTGSATAKDRNKDRIPDRWEKRHGLSLKKKQGRRDQDRDGLRNRVEFRLRTDPRDSDSDDDGVEDGDEGAGRITSFDPDTGELVINLFGGKSVSGLVTERTRIRCGCKGTDDDYGPGDDSTDPEPVPMHGAESGPDGDDSGPEIEDDGDDDRSSPDEGDDDRSGPDEGDDDGRPGPDRGGHHGHRDDRLCTTAELVEGTVVSEAELELTADGLVFDEIELVKRNPDGEPDPEEG